jgi:uncharacterized protein HemY
MNIEIYQSILPKFILSFFSGAGLLLSTKQVIIDLNFAMVFLMIIFTVVFAYGLNSLIRDFPKIKKAVKDWF